MEQLTTISSKSDFVDVRMSVTEFIFWKNMEKENLTQDEKVVIVKGLLGIQETFQCSKSTAFKIAHSQWFKPCLIKTGKHICFDKQKALELALENHSLYDFK